jgi:thioredoxin 1
MVSDRPQCVTLSVGFCKTRLDSLLTCFYSIRCGPCQVIGPIYEKLAGENTDVEFVKVDVDDADDVAAACGIQAMPTFQFYKGGAKIDEMKGADQAKLTQLLAKNK